MINAPLMAAPSANAALEPVRTRIHREMLSRLDLNQLEKMAPDALRAELQWLAGQLMDELKIALNESERRQVIQGIQDEMLGLGPLEPLLADPGISDILVNGPQQTWIERRGKLERSAVRFDDDAHLRRVIDRIVSRIGRRVDEMSPMVDARLPDGSRVNAVIPPLAIDGASLSIRRFGGDALLAPDKAHALIGCGLDADLIDLDRECCRNPGAHRRCEWHHLWRLGNHSCVDICDSVSGL